MLEQLELVDILRAKSSISEQSGNTFHNDKNKKGSSIDYFFIYKSLFVEMAKCNHEEPLKFT